MGFFFLPEINETVKETVDHEEDADRDYDDVPFVEILDVAGDLPGVVQQVLSLRRNLERKSIEQMKKSNNKKNSEIDNKKSL